jgi:hypothetical protein
MFVVLPELKRIIFLSASWVLLLGVTHCKLGLDKALGIHTAAVAANGRVQERLDEQNRNIIFGRLGTAMTTLAGQEGVRSGVVLGRPRGCFAGTFLAW